MDSLKIDSERIEKKHKNKIVYIKKIFLLHIKLSNKNSPSQTCLNTNDGLNAPKSMAIEYINPSLQH